MAKVFSGYGDHGDVLSFPTRCSSDFKKALGEAHPHTLTIINNMALVYDDKGDYDKALEMYEKCLEGRMKALGEAHPSTLRTIDNLAKLKLKLMKK